MRISTGQIFLSASNNMMENQTSLLDIQDKMSSGKQFTRLADDPVGASQVVSLKRELAQLEMFNSNIDASRRRLELEETTMDDLNTAQDRMRELVVYAANGVLSDADRMTISYELEELVEYSAGLMNTRDAKGEYLFSGSQGNVQTYEKIGNRYSYEGDASNRDIQVSSALYVQSTDNGRDLFESVTDEPTLKATGVLRGLVDDEAVNVTDVDAFNEFMREQGDITLGIDRFDDGLGNPDSVTYRYTMRNSAGEVIETPEQGVLQGIYAGVEPVEISIPGATVTLDLPIDPAFPATAPTLSATGDAAATLGNVFTEPEFVDLMRNLGDLQLDVQYNSGADTYDYTLVDSANNVIASNTGLAAGTVESIDLVGVNFDITIPSDGLSQQASFQLDTPADAELKLQYEQPPTNILNAIMETVEMMREPVDGTTDALAELKDRFALSLDQLTQSQERLAEATSTLGARMNKLDKAQLSNTDFQLMTESTLSAVQDLDYAAASTELAKRKLSLEAAYASFAQIKDLSLFNYIR